MLRNGDRNGLPIEIRSPSIRRLFSCSGYSAIITRRSRAYAPFDVAYVDTAPFVLDLAGKRRPRSPHDWMDPLPSASRVAQARDLLAPRIPTSRRCHR